MTDDKPCPYWGDDADPNMVKDYRASEAGFMAVLDAIAAGDTAAFSALCETMEPRDYAVAAYLFIDTVNSFAPLGVDVRSTVQGLRDQIQKDLSAALAAS